MVSHALLADYLDRAAERTVGFFKQIGVFLYRHDGIGLADDGAKALSLAKPSRP